MDEQRHPSGSEPLTPSERQFLIDSGAPPDSFDPARQEAARASLRARAEQTRRQAARELTVAQAAQLLRCSESEIAELAHNQDLYSIAHDDGLRFPEWQFVEGRRLPGLRLVLRELDPSVHPYSVEGLLADVPHEELDDRTAGSWLAHGGPVEPVVAIAESSAYDC